MTVDIIEKLESVLSAPHITEAIDVINDLRLHVRQLQACQEKTAIVVREGRVECHHEVGLVVMYGGELVTCDPKISGAVAGLDGAPSTS